MSRRRPVKVDERFLELLDQQLPAERGPQGEPSATDFLLVDLPPIAERFATSFDELMTRSRIGVTTGPCSVSGCSFPGFSSPECSKPMTL